MAKYKVIHPVRHDGKAHGRGAVIDLSTEDAKRLRKFGHVEPANGAAPTDGAVSAATTQLSASTLGKMNIAELTEYATSHNVKLDPAFTKDQILTALSEATPAAQ